MTSTLPATRIVVRRLPDLDGEPPERPVGPPRSPDPTAVPSPGSTTASPGGATTAGPADATTLAGPADATIATAAGATASDSSTFNHAAAARSSPSASGEDTGLAGPDRIRLYAHLVVRQFLEVLDGRRPAAQLADLVTEPVLRYLTAAVRQLDRPGRDATRRGRRPGAGLVPATERARGAGLRSMRICQPTDRVAEVSVVWRHRGRFRALAARFELPGEPPTTTPSGEIAGTGPRWRCTALRVG